MAYGILKCDNITFDNGGSDQNVTVSGLYNSLTSGVSVTGTISGSVVIGSTSVSGTTVLGTTVTGTTVQGTNGTFTSLTGTTITGTTINGVTVAATTGSFTSLTGTTTSGTTANFVSGVFTTQVSGTTVTGTTSSFTSGNFTTLSGATATFTSGVLALGTATNPSLSFASDPNTGIYSPGADQVAVATNGTGRLFVAADGKVGVGVGSPVTALQVVGTATFGNGVGGRLQATTDSNLGYIDSLNNTSTEWQPLLQRGTEIQFHTNTAGVTPTVKATITSAGLVGIGTSAPGTALEVLNGTDNNHLTLYKTGVAGGAGPGIRFNNQNNTGGSAYIAGITAELTSGTPGSEAGALVLSTRQTSDASPQKRVYISAGGSVGIGTTSPGQSLSVVAPSTAQAVGIWNRASDNTYGGIYFKTSDGATDQSSILNERAGTNGARLLFYTKADGGSLTERARIDSDGRLLVGTSSTSATCNALLQTGSGTGGTLILAYGNTSPADGQDLGFISFNDSSHIYNSAIIRAARDGGTWTSGTSMPTRLTFSTTADGASSPTERMRIAQGGNISIGTTNSTYSARLTCVPVTGTSGSAFHTDTATEYGTILINAATSGNNGFALFQSEAAPVTRGSITYNRGGGVVAYNTTSDYRAKTLLGAVENPGETIDALKVYRGVMNGATVERPMLVAHEAQEVAPYCVTGDKDAVDDDGNPVYQQMDHQVLVPLLIAEIQQLRARVAALESE